MIAQETIAGIARQWLADKEYFLVEVSVSQDNHIQVEIDHKDGVWIDDCVELSRYIETRLSREQEDYELEVGSAGIGQPFKVIQQYYNHVGREVELMAQDGQKYCGTLTRADEQGCSIAVTLRVKPEGAKRPHNVTEEKTFNYAEIKYTKYLISFK
ncbi:MAG: ribosome assembly cofactor RimP [Prevotellaceae bacterium]|jgi:ribosome maturation factor RimP|nr:ribosome assembly cofactor RimP [Prevotellaceae bacterium]